MKYLFCNKARKWGQRNAKVCLGRNRPELPSLHVEARAAECEGMLRTEPSRAADIVKLGPSCHHKAISSSVLPGMDDVGNRLQFPFVTFVALQILLINFNLVTRLSFR